MSIGCHCRHPGHRKCVLNRVAWKQPLGYFLAWLKVADDYTDGLGHTGAKRLTETVLSHENRVRAREEAKGNAEYNDLFGWGVPKDGVGPLRL